MLEEIMTRVKVLFALLICFLLPPKAIGFTTYDDEDNPEHPLLFSTNTAGCPQATS
jgi:hypothetical protein